MYIKGDLMKPLREFLMESPKPKDLRPGKKIEIDWTSGSGLDKGVVTGVGADYIKFKLDGDTSPHKDTSMIYFDEFKKYKLKVVG